MMTMYLQLDGLKGESTDSEHKDWIEVHSFNHSITQMPTPGTAVSAHCQHADYAITKPVDMTSPKLYEMCSSGKHIRSATLQMMRPMPDGTRAKCMEVKLEDVVISHVAPACGGELDSPSDTVSFKYSKITWTYTLPKRSDGSGGGNTTGSWSIVENRIAA